MYELCIFSNNIDCQNITSLFDHCSPMFDNSLCCSVKTPLQQKLYFLPWDHNRKILGEKNPTTITLFVYFVLAWSHCSPVLGQHRQPLQQDGDHCLVQVRSGGQRLQVHLLLGHLLRVGLLVLHCPLEAASRSTACRECVSLHRV